MDQPRYLQMVRTNQFERVYRRWKEKKLTQAEAAKQLEMSERTFRRYVVRYREGGMGGLLDRRLSKASPRRACAEERSEVVALYRDRYPRRNVRHFYEAYEETHGGGRSYSWVKSRLQEAAAVSRGRRRGSHREFRERKEQEGMMIHQDASTHRWVPGEQWDLVVTMDDATGVYTVLSSLFRRAPGAVSGECGTYWRARVYSQVFTATEGLTTGTRPKPEVAWTRKTRRSSGVR